MRRAVLAAGGLASLLLTGVVLGTGAAPDSKAGGLFGWACCHPRCGPACEEGPGVGEVGGTWYWLRSPDEEKRVVSSLFNRYCIRCHGQDGRGIWDIPGVPNFTNPVWQASRSDSQIATIILEGRGAVMPPFRGTLSLEEAWAMARHLRTFEPGTQLPRPDLGQPERPGMPEKLPPAPMPPAPPAPGLP
jgi:hypothetical protein